MKPGQEEEAEEFKHGSKVYKVVQSASKQSSGLHWILEVLSCQSAAHIQQAIAMVKSSSSAKTPVVVSQYAACS